MARTYVPIGRDVSVSNVSKIYKANKNGIDVPSA